MKLFFLAFVSLVVLSFASSCGDGEAEDDSPPTDANATPVSAVTIMLTNWAIEPSASVLAAGKVTFTATHPQDHGAGHGASEGGATHQLLVAPLEAGGKAGQSKFGNPVLNLTDIKPGETKMAEIDLAPGRYEIACLVVEQVAGKSVSHYEKGMHTVVVVQ